MQIIWGVEADPEGLLPAAVAGVSRCVFHSRAGADGQTILTTTKG
jgi:hypothetical protein